jgi:hypothetical protein
MAQAKLIAKGNRRVKSIVKAIAANVNNARLTGAAFAEDSREYRSPH